MLFECHGGLTLEQFQKSFNGLSRCKVSNTAPLYGWPWLTSLLKLVSSLKSHLILFIQAYKLLHKAPMPGSQGNESYLA